MLLIVPAALSGKVCDITTFGGKADGKTLNTDAFKQAIAACAGGGTVLVPGNGSYLTAPMNLTSNQRLEVEKGATILGSTDTKLYPLMAPFPSMGGVITRDGYKCRYGPLVGAFNATNISIAGEGTIDGSGAWWWDNRHKLGVESPRLVELQVHGISHGVRWMPTARNSLLLVVALACDRAHNQRHLAQKQSLLDFTPDLLPGHSYS